MSDEIKIEDGIPVPKRANYPFTKLAVGQSFYLGPDHHGAGNSGASTSPRVHPAAVSHGRRHGKKFAVYRQPDGGYRVWRVK